MDIVKILEDCEREIHFNNEKVSAINREIMQSTKEKNHHKVLLLLLEKNDIAVFNLKLKEKIFFYLKLNSLIGNRLP